MAGGAVPGVEAMGRQLQDFTPQDLANAAWSCVAMPAVDAPLLGALWSRARELRAQLDDKALRQLHQVRVIAGKESPTCIPQEPDPEPDAAPEPDEAPIEDWLRRVRKYYYTE